jgi:hypothetical protein
MESEYLIIQADEAVFSRKTIRNVCWRSRNMQFKMVDFREKLQTFSVLAGISGSNGLESFLIR